MANNLKQQFEDFIEVLLVLVKDTILVISVAFFTHLVKLFIEWIYGQELASIDNLAMVYVYSISKYLIITTIFLFAVFDIYLQIRRIIKRLKDV